MIVSPMKRTLPAVVDQCATVQGFRWCHSERGILCKFISKHLLLFHRKWFTLIIFSKTRLKLCLSAENGCNKFETDFQLKIFFFSDTLRVSELAISSFQNDGCLCPTINDLASMTKVEKSGRTQTRRRRWRQRRPQRRQRQHWRWRRRPSCNDFAP